MQKKKFDKKNYQEKMEKRLTIYSLFTFLIQLISSFYMVIIFKKLF